MLVLNYTYRIYPDANQEDLLNDWLDTNRRAYNYALRELKDWLASRSSPIDRCSLEYEYIMPADYPFPGYQEQQNALPPAKKIFPKLAEVLVALRRGFSKSRDQAQRPSFANNYKEIA